MNGKATAPEARKSKHPLRQLLYGGKRHIYRVVYSIDEKRKAVRVLIILTALWNQRSCASEATPLLEDQRDVHGNGRGQAVVDVQHVGGVLAGVGGALLFDRITDEAGLCRCARA